MLAALQTGIRSIEVREIPDPIPNADQGVIRVRQTGICGSDLHPYHRRAEPQTAPAGHEVCGEVISLPNGYSGPVRVGDLVAVNGLLGTACGDCDFCRRGQTYHCPVRRAAPTFSGGFAELLARKPAGFFPLPAGVTLDQGALVEPLAVAVHGVRWSRMQPGATVVVIGAGTIGLTTLIAARALGAGAVHIIARHPQQAALASELGAATVLPDDPSANPAQVRDLTGGLGADLVVETVGGHADTLNLAWELVRQQGTVAVLGIFPRPLPINLLAPVMREAWVTFPNCYGVIDGRHDYDVSIELIAGGRTGIERLVTSRFPLAEAAAAFETAADKSSGSIKVHVTMGR
jgi:threonine dehydrogenase-like Zn-dependent dehydrogenase